jgi:hypothetical protein
MSFDLFVIFFGETEREGISRERVRKLFPIVEKESDSSRWSIRYDARNHSEVHPGNDAVTLKGLSVNRPCGELRLWRASHSILQMGQVFLCWPGGPPVVASDSVAAALPANVKESLGRAHIVKSGEEILELVRNT